MHISVAKFGGEDDLLTIEIASDLTIKDLKVVIESESDFGIQAQQMNLYHDGNLLENENLTLDQTNIKDYDVVTCQRIPSSADVNSQGNVGLNLASQTEELRRLFDELRRIPPTISQQLRQSDPQLAQILDRNDFNAFAQHLMSQMAARRMHRPTEFDLLDPDMQRRIEERINMENVQDNMEHAYEHAPEFFGNVIMLYINCKVNGHPIKAFVDSGAQMTIMSKACAERCGVMRLLDRRFAGIARGVGTQNILGRIHLAQLEVEDQFFATSLSVLEDQSIDMLIGLDMLRRHRCVLDLDKNVLRIENTVETRFLSESELPSHARLTGNTPDVDSPNLSEAFQRSSAASGGTRQQQRTDISTGATASPFPEKAINEITKKGFSREQAVEELKSTNGDVTKALIQLMTKNLAKSKIKK